MDMKVDEDTGSHQSYAFITFAGTEKAKATDVVESICHSKYQRIGSHLCEVKKAHSKNAKFIKNAERSSVLVFWWFLNSFSRTPPRKPVHAR